MRFANILDQMYLITIFQKIVDMEGSSNTMYI
jgi:hypothetical protein